MSKKVTSYNLKKTNSAALADKSLLAGYGSTSLYLDKLMDIYLSDNGFLVDLSDESAALLKGLIDKHERTAGFLLDKMIRKFCGEVEVATVANNATVETAVNPKPKAPKIKRKVINYPSNLDEQFLLLWDSKGKKGQKQKAYDIFRKMCIDVTDDICEQATLLMIADLHKNKHEAGYPERHLTSYLNGKFWEE